MIDGIKINEQQKQRYMEHGDWGEKTLLDYWNDTVKLFEDREYVVDDRGKRYTYREVDLLAEKTAAYFRHCGVQQQEVISYQIPIWSEFVIITIACLKAGAVMNPLGMCFVNEELEKLLVLSESVMYICPVQYRHISYEENIRAVKKRVSSLKHVVFIGEPVKCDGTGYSLETIFERSEPFEPYAPGQKECRMDSNQAALILCTSGTTRGTKEVILTHNNILFSELTFNRALGINQEDIMFMPAPLNHATGFHHGVIATMLCGAKLVLMQKFDCRAAIELMNREQCTYSMGATPFIYDILKSMEEESTALTYLKFYLCGGAPVPEKMTKKAAIYGIKLCEVYGSTESVPHVFVRPDEVLCRTHISSGTPMDGVEVRVVDELGRDVGCNIPGEEISRGPNVFVGYLHDETATNNALDEEGWFYSGDICVKDESGNIRIIGRKKDMIVRGGENLNANDIDNDIEGCPGVMDHSVIGMPDERLGERICAYLVLQQKTASVTLCQLTEYLKEKQVNKRYWPERVEIIEAIPRTDSGKVKKYVLQENLKERMGGTGNK